MIPIIAAVSGTGLINQLAFALIILLCLAILWWIGKWCIGAIGAPAVALTIWNGLFILLGGLALINFLLGLVDRSFIRW